MPKFKPTALPSEEPDVTGGNFYDGPVPPVGVYHGRLKQLKVAPTSKGGEMFKCLVEIDETRPAKQQFNGYGLWGNVNIQESTAQFVARLARALGATYADIQKGNVVIDSEDPPNVVKVGKVKVTGDNKVSVSTRINEYNGTTSLQIGAFLPPKDEAANGAVDDSSDDEEDDGLAVADAEVDGDPSEDEADRLEELEGMSKAELLEVVEELELELPGRAKNAVIIEAIIEKEFNDTAAAADDDGADASEEEEELREELADLTPVKLRKRAKEAGVTGVTRESDTDDLIDGIVELELSDEPPF